MGWGYYDEGGVCVLGLPRPSGRRHSFINFIYDVLLTTTTTTSMYVCMYVWMYIYEFMYVYNEFMYVSVPPQL